jgi:predicted peptidase
MNYLVTLPEKYMEQTNGKFPLIIFLHGVNERGNDIEILKRNGLPAIVDSIPDFPFILISPQCPLGKTWSVEALQSMYEEILNKYRVDNNRVYLTGLSMGGFGTWAWASRYHWQFAAIAPICGGGDPALAKHLIRTPIWAFHGDADPIVPLQRTVEMVEAVNHLGGSALLTIYKGVGHDSWTQTYNTPELYEWFLNHSLLKKKAE